jgi:hypothetical protein
VLFALTIGAWGQAKAPLVLLQTIPLPGLHDGDFDHFAVDLAGHRLFQTAEENAVVEVFDFRTNKLIHSLTDIDEAHSMLYRTDLKKLFVVDGGAPEVKIYQDGSTNVWELRKLRDDADSMAYDASTKYLISVLDTSSDVFASNIDEHPPP